MSDGYEFRVGWRREHDKRQRRRIYQTQEAAEWFAGILEDNPDPEWGLDGILADNLARTGEPTDVTVERRVVGEWEPYRV